GAPVAAGVRATSLGVAALLTWAAALLDICPYRRGHWAIAPARQIAEVVSAIARVLQIPWINVLTRFSRSAQALDAGNGV
ncbi:MAG: hypothetical protein VKK04_04070, partial [Synechococcales bacterium]|nr:hypothetical protein [Synechococcales bacterium]